MWIALPVAYLAAAVAVHAIVARVRPAGGRVRQFLGSGVLVGLVMVAHASHQFGSNPEAGIAAVLLFAFGCELYLFLFTFVTSSVSVALIVSPGTAQIADAPADMVSRRLATMHAAGLLEGRSGGYGLTSQGRRLVRTYRLLRHFFRHRDES